MCSSKWSTLGGVFGAPNMYPWYTYLRIMFGRLLTSVLEALERSNRERQWALHKVKDRGESLAIICEQTQRLNQEIDDFTHTCEVVHLVTCQKMAWDMLRQRQLLTRIVCRIQRRATTEALDIWRDVLAQHQRHIHIELTVVQRMLHRTRTVALTTWVREVAEERRRMQLMLIILQRMQLRSSVIVFKEWAFVVCQDKRKRLLMTTIMHRVAHGGIARRFDRWNTYLTQHKAQQQIYAGLTKILRRLQTNNFTRAFERWCNAIGEAAACSSVQVRGKADAPASNNVGVGHLYRQHHST